MEKKNLTIKFNNGETQSFKGVSNIELNFGKNIMHVSHEGADLPNESEISNDIRTVTSVEWNLDKSSPSKFETVFDSNKEANSTLFDVDTPVKSVKSDSVKKK